MTIPEAQEQLEILTVKLACSTDLQQRLEIEKQIARCYRVIQLAQQQAHRSLVRVADTLLSIGEELTLTEVQSEAISLSAQMIHRATTEQLAVAVSSAITDHAANTLPPKLEGLLQIDSILRSIYNGLNSYEQRLAIRTALLLFSLTGKSQISQSVLHFRENFDIKIAEKRQELEQELHLHLA